MDADEYFVRYGCGNRDESGAVDGLEAAPSTGEDEGGVIGRGRHGFSRLRFDNWMS